MLYDLFLVTKDLTRKQTPTAANAPTENVPTLFHFWRVVVGWVVGRVVGWMLNAKLVVSNWWSPTRRVVEE